MTQARELSQIERLVIALYAADTVRDMLLDVWAADDTQAWAIRDSSHLVTMMDRIRKQLKVQYEAQIRRPKDH